MKEDRGQVFNFNKFRLDPGHMTLWYEDEVVHITPKALEILVLLVRNAGETVSREEILDSVWKGTYIEEGNINFNISSLRKLLRKHSGTKTVFINTVPKIGYRFADIVEKNSVVQRNGDSNTRPSEGGAALIPTQSSESNKIRWHLIAIVLLGVFLVSSFALWWKVEYGEAISKAPASGRKFASIAVLPLKPLSEDKSERTFSIGLTESLIIKLGSLDKFAVRPLSAVIDFENSGKDGVEYAKTLEVDAVIEGSFQKVDDRLRINIRLVDVRDGAQLWADVFETKETELFELQDRISREIAVRILNDLGYSETSRLQKRPTSNLEAYEQYLKGKEIWSRRTPGTEAVPFFERAIELDPNFALAYLGLADALVFRQPPQERALEAVRKAIELDPSLAEAYATLGFFQMFHQWDWKNAESSFRKALRFGPNDAKSHHWYGVYLSLTGKLDEAEKEMRIAEELSPTSLVYISDIAQIYYFKKEFEKAEDLLQQILLSDQGSARAYGYLYHVYLQSGREREAFESQIKLYKLTLRDAQNESKIFDQSGMSGVLRDKIRRDKCWPNGNIKSIFCAYDIAAIKSKDLDPLPHLESAVRTREFLLPFIKIDPTWDAYRDDPRFLQLLWKMGLSDAM